MKSFDPQYTNYFVHHFIKFLKKNKAYDGWSKAILSRYSGPQEVFSSYGYIHWVGSTFRWMNHTPDGEKCSISTNTADANFRFWEQLNIRWEKLTLELIKEDEKDGD